MLKTLKHIVNLLRNLNLENIKKFFITFGLYLLNLLKGIWTGIKSNSGEALLYIIWAIISFVYGFTFAILSMIVYSCYIHHIQEKDGHCDICNHEDILRYTLIICIFSLLHIIL